MEIMVCIIIFNPGIVVDSCFYSVSWQRLCRKYKYLLKERTYKFDLTYQAGNNQI